MNDAGLLSIIDTVLIVSAVVVALIAVLVRTRAAAVTVFLVFGVILAVVWARLGAPDVALAEAALGGGVAGALLVDALSDRRPPPPGDSRPRFVPIALASLLGAGAAAGLVVVMTQLSQQRSDLADVVMTELPESGVEHPVTAVLLNYRSYDTLLEIVVLVAAAVGIRALGARKLGGTASLPRSVEPALRALTIIVVPLLVVLAGWLLFAGTTRPGGAFQAGALLGAALILTALAGLVPRTRALVQLLAVIAGMLIFIAIGAITALGSGWFTLDPAWAGVVIVGVETVLSLSIAAGLAVMFFGARPAVETGAEPGQDREKKHDGEASRA